MNKLDLDEKNFSHFINGAKIIGLIKEENGLFRITDEGFLLKTLLRTKELHSIEGINTIKGNLNTRDMKKSLYTEYRDIATALRMIYQKNPLFTELLEIFVQTEEKKLTFHEIIKEVVDNKPNLFLNLFCLESKIDKVQEIYQSGESGKKC